mgnify:CR=1 FL=1
MALQTWAAKTNLKKGLNAGDLEKSLKNDKYFAGIIKIEDLNKIVINSYPLSLIMLIRDHWVGLFITKNKIEIFDSAQLIWDDPPSEFIQFLCANASKKLAINKPMQKNGSFLCGLFVLFFIKMKSRNWKWRKIINFFKKNKTNSIIRRLFRC